MTASRKSEHRALSQDEHELIDRTHRPALTALKQDELSQLIALVRERRDRARDIAHRQRRQVRGKDRAKRAVPENADAGKRLKAAILGEALARLSEERSRRTARSDLIASARKALALKRAASRQSRPPSAPTASTGMTPKPKKRAKRIGSAMEAGRVSQFVRDAQAKRDAR
jgi:hypothetical protein